MSTALPLSPSISPPLHLINAILPVETKTQIFSHLHSSTTSSANSPPLSSKLHPSDLLAQVCSEWRAITLSTPELWSDIKVCLPNLFDANSKANGRNGAYPRQMKALERRIKVWLERSKAHPLRVTIINATRPKHSDPPSFDDALDSLWSVLAATSPRWVELDIAITDARDGRWILYELRSTDDGSTAAGRRTPSAILSSLASLRIGGVDGFKLGSFTPMVRQSWVTLRNLELGIDGDLYIIFGFLRRCSNLVSLALKRRVGRTSDDWVHPHLGTKVVRLPHLESIAFVGGLPGPNCHELFDLPMLRSLALVNMTHGGYPVRQMEVSLTKWMERFGGQLTEFRISGSSSAFPSTWWVLGIIKDNLVPNLRSLRLIGRTDYEALLGKLSSLAPGGGLYCPNLETFVSAPGGSGESWMSEQGALRFLQSRLVHSTNIECAESVSRLRCVNIGVKGVKEPYSDEELESKGRDLVSELRGKGIDLQGVTLKVTYMVRTMIGGPWVRTLRNEDIDEEVNRNANERAFQVEVEKLRRWKTLVVDCGDVLVHPLPSPDQRNAEVILEEDGEQEEEKDPEGGGYCDGIEFALPYRTPLA